MVIRKTRRRKLVRTLICCAYFIFVILVSGPAWDLYFRFLLFLDFGSVLESGPALLIPSYFSLKPPFKDPTGLISGYKVLFSSQYLLDYVVSDVMGANTSSPVCALGNVNSLLVCSSIGASTPIKAGLIDSHLKINIPTFLSVVPYICVKSLGFRLTLRFFLFQNHPT